MARSRITPPSSTGIGKGMNRRTMHGPGQQEQMRFLASNGASPEVLLEAMQMGPKSNNFDPEVFQHAAEIAQRNNQLQVQQQQAAQEQQLERDQMAMQERQANARGTLDHQRAKSDAQLRGRGLEMEDRNSQQRFGLARLQESKQMGDQQRLDADWAQQSANSLDVDMRGLLDAARGIDYTPEGRRAYAALAAEGRAIQANRSKMRPGAYSQMAGEFMERFEGADLGSHQRQPMTIKEVMSRQMSDVGNGMLATMEPDGSNFRIVNGTAGKDMKALADMEAGGDAGMQQIIPAKQRMLSALGGAKNAGAFDKAYKAAEDAMKAEWQMNPANADAMNAPAMDPAAVRARMLQSYQNQEDFEREMYGGAPAAGVPAPAGGEELTPGQAFKQRIQAEKAAALQSGKPGSELPGYVGGDNSPGFLHDLKGQYSQMADVFRSRPPEDGPASEGGVSRAEADELYFQGERQSAIKSSFDDALQPKNRLRPKNQAFRELSDAVRSAKLPSHPARYIDERAVSLFEQLGSKDPTGDAAASVSSAIKEGGEHFSLKPQWEQEALANSLPVLDPADDADEIKKLKPGDYYMDRGLRIHRIPPRDKSMAERAADPLRGKKFDPMMFRGMSP